MINISPKGSLYLCKTQLENDYKNQLTFTNKEKQQEYFQSKVTNSFSNYTYIRKDGTIKIEASIDTIINCNYLFYKNNDFSDKYYYCFITNIEYLSENSSLITFETDVFQTWYFDINYKQCFVEREHVNNDTIGINTIPEGLETGDYIINYGEQIDPFSNSTYVCMGCSEVPTNFPTDTNNRKYGGVYSGLIYIVFDSAENVSKMIKAYDKEAKSNAIYSLFLIPTNISNISEWYTTSLGGETNIRFAIPTFSENAKIMIENKEININDKINNYIPKNNKLFCYPYNYLYITNNNGSDCIYNYEDFINNKPIFNIDGVISTGCGIKLYPLNYKKVSSDVWKRVNYNYGIVGGKYPTCSWVSDSYTNWLTENALNIGISAVGSVVNIVGGVSSTNPGMVASGINGIFNTLSSVYQHSLIPDQAKGNTNSGDITMASKAMGFVAYQMSIKSEYAKIIDDYFSMFGYKINRIKIPFITGRQNWNYVKTIDCNFDGDIPQTDLQIIKNMFNNGITLWHNPNTMLDYSQSNNII